MARWQEILKDLSKSFEEHDRKLEFLRHIDSQILNEEVSLEEISDYVVRWLTEHTRANEGYLLLNTGVHLSPLICTAQEPILIPSIELTPDIDTLIHETRIVRHDDAETQTPTFPSYSDNINHTLLAPVKSALKLVANDSSHNLWGVIGLEFEKQVPHQSETDELLKFLDMACGQLEIAINERRQFRENERLSKIQQRLFEKELDITDSLQAILDNIIPSLPQIGPLKIYPDPGVQILFYTKGDEFLVIKATTGHEEVNTRVSVKDSISGYLVENREYPFYLCDPTQEKGRYKAYLEIGEKGQPAKKIRSELVVPIVFEEQLIGVINVESENAGAFTIRHILTLQQLADAAAPIINSLQKRLEKIQIQDKASVYTMRKYLERLTPIFSHKIHGLEDKVSYPIGVVEEILQSSEEEIDRTVLLDNLALASRHFAELTEHQNNFFVNLERYLVNDRISINEIVSEAIAQHKPDRLASQLTIEFTPGEDHYVFCSPFFIEHIYNLIENSKYYIRLKSTSESKPSHYKGLIKIKTELVVDNLVSEINQQCKITIHDNGMGASKEILEKLPSGHTTKPLGSGSGLGVSACFHYLKSIGGKLDLVSDELEYFEASMYVDIFVESLHRHKVGQLASGD